jgi:hypothetical protein
LQLIFPNSRYLDLTSVAEHQRAPVKGETFTVAGFEETHPHVDGHYIVNHVDWVLGSERGLEPNIYLEKVSSE